MLVMPSFLDICMINTAVYRKMYGSHMKIFIQWNSIILVDGKIKKKKESNKFKELSGHIFQWST